MRESNSTTYPYFKKKKNFHYNHSLNFKLEKYTNHITNIIIITIKDHPSNMNASILSAETESLLPFSVTKKCKRTTFENKKKKKKAHIDQ